jgi:hypothetical protein
MDITAALALSLGGAYSLDAYLYESAAGGNGNYKMIEASKVNLFENEETALIGLRIVNPGVYNSKPLASQDIKITKGNRYIVIVILSQTEGANLAATVAGSISGSLSLACAEGTGGGGGVAPVMPFGIRNGLHLHTDAGTGEVYAGMGGYLIEETDITLNGKKLNFIAMDADTVNVTGNFSTDSLYIDALENAESGSKTKALVWNEESKRVEAAANAKDWFYMPATVLPTAETAAEYDGTQFTVNLYNIYTAQFGMTPENSAGSNEEKTIATYDDEELDYLVTYFDPEVFTDVAVSDAGVLTYKVKAGAVPTLATFMNIVFQVK